MSHEGLWPAFRGPPKPHPNFPGSRDRLVVGGVVVQVRREGPWFQQVEVLPRQRSSQPGSYLSSRGGNEAAEAWEKGGSFGLSASWQAVTRVNTETTPKVTMRRPTLPGLGEGCYGPGSTGRRARPASPGWWVTACQQGIAGNTGSPPWWPGRPGQQAHGASGRSGWRRGSYYR